MPALTDITDRIDADSAWRTAYNNNLHDARHIAESIYLIHVSGHFIPFDDLVGVPPYELPISIESIGYCSQLTRDSEDAHGLNRSLYFYAGRACNEFGPVALAFAASCESKHTGSATPYDTGGLFKGYIRWNLPDHEPPTIAKFTNESIFDLKEWREAFATYLAAYFNPPITYWEGLPWKDDPDGLFQPANHWRAWVFEIRFNEGQSIFEAEAWCARPDQSDSLWLIAEEEPPIGSLITPLQQFLNSTIEIVPGGTPYYCEELESWVERKVLP